MSDPEAFYAREAIIRIIGWGGITEQTVLVKAETPKCYRVVAPAGQRVKLAGRSRWIEGNESALVRKRYVRFLS